jgi:hypothetical protein
MRFKWLFLGATKDLHIVIVALMIKVHADDSH